MVKFSDFSKLTDKLDVSGLVKNVKSMVNPEQGAMQSTAVDASAAGCDVLSQKMAEINAAVQSLVSASSQQAEAVSKMNKALASLAAEIEKLRTASPQAAAAQETPAPSAAQPVTSEPAAGDKPETGENKPEAGQ